MRTRHLPAGMLGVLVLASGCGAGALSVGMIGQPPVLVTTTTTTAAAMPAPPPPPAVSAPSRAPAARPVAFPPGWLGARVPPPERGGEAAPLTGLTAADPQLAHRPALVVKIDNAPKAWPQAGLNEADVVYEEAVEGGMTRFAAIFHSQLPEPVGPVRSARSTDIGLISPLNWPLFSYSGANAVFERYVREAPVSDVGAERFPRQYTRDRRRSAPSNLFVGAARLSALMTRKTTGPPALFAYRPAGQRPGGARIRPVGRAGAHWEHKGRAATSVSYDWNPGTGTWSRIQNGRLHIDAAGRAVTPANVIFQFTPYRNTGLDDSTGAEVPEAVVVGEGESWVLTGGHLIPAWWAKHSQMEITRYVDVAGNEVRLTPGPTWVELVPPGTGRYTSRSADPAAPGSGAQPVPDDGPLFPARPSPRPESGSGPEHAPAPRPPAESDAEERSPSPKENAPPPSQPPPTTPAPGPPSKPPEPFPSPAPIPSTPPSPVPPGTGPPFSGVSARSQR